MIQESKHFWKQVVIEEYYTKSLIDGKVYRHWRFPETNQEWQKEETCLKEVPYVVLNHLNK